MVDIPVTVNDAVITVVITANGQTDVDFDFLIFDKDHVKAIFTELATGIQTDLTNVADFTIDGIEDPNGETLTLLAISTLIGDTVTIYRDVPVERLADYQQSGDFFAATINRELDLQTQMMQELRRDIDTTIKFPVGDAGNAVLPNASTRASTLMGFDALGDVDVFAGSSGVPVSAFMATLLDDTTLAAAKLTLGDYVTVTLLKADAVLSYLPGTGLTVVAVGDIIRAQGFDYEVQASGASGDISNSAGTPVQLNVLAGEKGFNLKAFDAVGDGVADDTAALLQAASRGGVVYAPSGTYKLTVWNNLLGIRGLVGDGDSTVFNCVGAGGIYVLATSGSPDTQGMVFKDFKVTGDATVSEAGVFTRYVDNITIDNVTVDNFGISRTFGGDGIKVRNGSNVRVNSCRVTNIGYAMINLQDCVQAYVTRNYIKASERYGIYVFGACDKVVVSNNIVINVGSLQGDSGIFFLDDAVTITKTATVTGNYVENSGDHGIHVLYYMSNTNPGGDASPILGIAITGNTCINHQVVGGGAGIITENARNVTITGNTCQNNNLGIHLWHSVEIEVAGNMVSGSLEKGISAAGSQHCSIVGNMLRDSGAGLPNGDGINLLNTAFFTTDRILVAANNVRNSDNRDIYVGSAVTNTTVNGNKIDGVVIDAGTGTWVGFNNVSGLQGEVNTLTRFSGGVGTLTKAGVISDTDFATTPNDGTLGVDITNDRLYVRLNGAWKYAALI